MLPPAFVPYGSARRTLLRQRCIQSGTEAEENVICNVGLSADNMVGRVICFFHELAIRLGKKMANGTEGECSAHLPKLPQGLFLGHGISFVGRRRGSSLNGICTFQLLDEADKKPLPFSEAVRRRH